MMKMMLDSWVTYTERYSLPYLFLLPGVTLWLKELESQTNHSPSHFKSSLALCFISKICLCLESLNNGLSRIIFFFVSSKNSFNSFSDHIKLITKHLWSFSSSSWSEQPISNDRFRKNPRICSRHRRREDHLVLHRNSVCSPSNERQPIPSQSYFIPTLNF